MYLYYIMQKVFNATTTESDMSRWFGARPSSAAHTRLFGFPYGGGSGSTAYRDWSKRAGADVDVIPVNFPGRQARLNEPPVTSMTLLMQTLAAEVEPLLDRPFALAGQSVGAFVALELARTLAARGFEPAHLFVIAAPAPHLPSDADGLGSAQDDVLIAHLRRLNGTPPGVLADPMLRSLFLPAIRADFQLRDSWEVRIDPPLRCGISVFGGLDDIFITEPALDAWQSFTRGPFTRRMFAGDHFFHVPRRDEVVAAIVDVLAA